MLDTLIGMFAVGIAGVAVLWLLFTVLGFLVMLLTSLPAILYALFMYFGPIVVAVGAWEYTPDPIAFLITIGCIAWYLKVIPSDGDAMGDVEGF